MKNLIGIFAILILFSTNTFSQSSAAESYILEYNHDLNKTSAPVFVNDLSSLNTTKEAFDNKGVNNTTVTYVFVGDTVNASKRISFSIDATAGGSEKPFIYYSLNTEDGLTTLTMLCGNSSI